MAAGDRVLGPKTRHLSSVKRDQLSNLHQNHSHANGPAYSSRARFLEDADVTRRGGWPPRLGPPSRGWRSALGYLVTEGHWSKREDPVGRRCGSSATTFAFRLRACF